jgi:glycogen synthase
VYKEQPEQWLNIQRAGMSQNFGWGRAARAYEQVIHSVRSRESQVAGLKKEPDKVATS